MSIPYAFWDISEVGRCAKAYCEHTARITPTLSDTVVTLIEMGEFNFRKDAKELQLENEIPI